MKRSYFIKGLKWIVAAIGLALIGIIITIIVYSTRSIRDILVQDGDMVNRTYNINRGDTEKYKTIKGDETPINNGYVKIIYNGKQIHTPIYEKGLRYYIDLEEGVKSLGISYTGNILTQGNNKVYLNLKDGTYKKNNEEFALRGENINHKGAPLIALNDLNNMFNLRDKWDIENRTVYIFNDNKKITPKEEKQSGRAALIRLEDVSSGGYCGSSIAKEKMKVIGDMLYTNNMKFHVAWVPRYVNPEEGIDNHMSKNPTMDNIQFINMLDHLINRGGVVGLHGYTHQSGSEPSLAGWELTRTINSSEEETRAVVENSIKEAKTLNIPVGFFESPHYGATGGQQKIIEEYFNILYEPYSPSYNLNPMIGFRGEGKLYLPAPMGYVTDKNGESICKKIKLFNKHILSSLFIHGSAQIPFIELGQVDEKGYVDYNILSDSPLENIIKTLKETGHVSITTKDF
ncbi:MAG: DUF2334 domain-containing protein [Clostridium sp.]